MLLVYIKYLEYTPLSYQFFNLTHKVLHDLNFAFFSSTLCYFLSNSQGFSLNNFKALIIKPSFLKLSHHTCCSLYLESSVFTYVLNCVLICSARDNILLDPVNFPFTAFISLWLLCLSFSFVYHLGRGLSYSTGTWSLQYYWSIIQCLICNNCLIIFLLTSKILKHINF